MALKEMTLNIVIAISTRNIYGNMERIEIPLLQLIFPHLAIIKANIGDFFSVSAIWERGKRRLLEGEKENGHEW